MLNSLRLSCYGIGQRHYRLIALGAGLVLAFILLTLSLALSLTLTNAQPAYAASCTGPDSFSYACTDVNRLFAPGTTDIGSHCDDCTTPVELPFSFSFYGKQYTSTIVSANGNLQFESSNFISYTLPTATFNQVIMPFGADLCTNVDCGENNPTSGGNGIFTATVGTAPHRVFIIEWRAHFYRVQALQPTMDFELQLEEQTNNVYFVYGNSTETYPTSWYMGGIQQNMGSEDYLISFGPIDPYATPVLNNNTALCFSTAPNCPGPTPPATVRATKSVTPAAAIPGQVITYTLVFSNASPTIATNVRITDVMLADLGNLSYSLTGVGYSEVPQVHYAWMLNDLQPGAGGTLTITGVLSDDLPPGTVVVNTAAIAADGVEHPSNSVGFMVKCMPTRVVNTTQDSGPGSLRQAIADVCSGGNINFDLTYPTMITLTSGELVINKDLTIDGPGAISLTISGKNTSRVFGINPELAVTISGLTVANGAAIGADCSTNGCGGGIQILDNALVLLQDMTLTRSSAGYLGGGLFTTIGANVTLNSVSVVSNTAFDRGGGAYFDQSQVTLNSSTVASNTAVKNGGGLYNYLGTLTVNGSAFHHNSAFEGGAIFHQSGVLDVEDSAIYRNIARQSSGGGISNWNDANVIGASATIVNSTIAENWSGDFGAAGIRNGISTTLTLVNSSVVSNTAMVSVTGNTIFAAGIRSAGAMSLINTLLAGNNAGVQTVGKDCWSAGSLQTDTHNLIVSNNHCGTPVAAANPLLAPFGDYGGPTPVYALLPGSPAIDAGDDAACTANDQRGVARTTGACDIGAFESQGFAVVYSGGDQQSTPIGTAFAQPLAVMIAANANGEPVTGGQVIFAAPGSGASTSPGIYTATVVANGIATQTVMANGTVGGPYIVTASANGAAPAIDFNLSNLANQYHAFIAFSGTGRSHHAFLATVHRP